MNPDSQAAQRPTAGAPQYGGAPALSPQSQTMPSYASDPRALLQASGAPPPAAGAGQPLAMPLPPAQTVTPMSNPAVSPPTAQSPLPAGAYPAPQPVSPAGPVAATPGNYHLAPEPGVKPVIANPNTTQNMLQIAEIRDGIVIMNDGSFRSVIMVNSINFDLMSRSEQEAVEYNYQNFLNSLFFPVQIFIRSQKVDMAPYIEKLDKVRSEHDNMLLSLLMDDYVTYIDNLSQQTNIMDKKFYIVIPFFPVVDVQKTFTQSKNFVTGFSALFGNKDQHVVINEADLEKAKSELRNRVQTVLDGLLQCNIQSLPLDTQELIELYYDTYNPDTATRQQLKNFGDMDTDIVGKGVGVAPQPNLDRELQ